MQSSGENPQKEQPSKFVWSSSSKKDNATNGFFGLGLVPKNV